MGHLNPPFELPEVLACLRVRPHKGETLPESMILAAEGSLHLQGCLEVRRIQSAGKRLTLGEKGGDQVGCGFERDRYWLAKGVGSFNVL
jgi:hypothetical protein